MATLTTDNILKIFDAGLKDKIVEEEYPIFSFKVQIIFSTYDTNLTKVSVASNTNRKWLMDKEYDFRIDALGISGDGLFRNYYFKDEKHALLFTLWCGHNE